jgi:hypothetical protein
MAMSDGTNGDPVGFGWSKTHKTKLVGDGFFFIKYGKKA